MSHYLWYIRDRTLYNADAAVRGPLTPVYWTLRNGIGGRLRGVNLTNDSDAFIFALILLRTNNFDSA